MLGKIFFYVSPNRDFEKIFLPSFGDFGGWGGGGGNRGKNVSDLRGLMTNRKEDDFKRGSRSICLAAKKRGKILNLNFSA